MNGFYNFKVAVALQAKHINTFRNAKLKPLKISAPTDSTKIHSFISNLSDDRSTASSKTIPPLNAI
jgi:hypothetical protein